MWFKTSWYVLYYKIVTCGNFLTIFAVLRITFSVYPVADPCLARAHMCLQPLAGLMISSMLPWCIETPNVVRVDGCEAMRQAEDGAVRSE